MVMSMPASKALVEQLLALPGDLRDELGRLLHGDDDDIGRSTLGQVLLESVMEEMTPEEQAALDAAIDESYADMEAGRTRPAAEVIAELRARRAQRAAG
jgi:predicted transcriptional regulator